MEKHLTLVFYASNGAAAKAAVAKIRAEGRSAQLRDAIVYGGEAEPCNAVLVMPDVSAFDRARIDLAYGDKVTRQEKPKLSLPPPPVTKGK